ncbi:putative bifunctional diguanylate cyclase/phosphodiesterase [Xanthobacter sp. AM11]|uniref:putative bifunctional diguanylate cyclase/phosphodiesterase n=1 Tax=Xanthobacter sp. AM11 TaxID=3380643 RepID=UPI0039BFD8E1
MNAREGWTLPAALAAAVLVAGLGAAVFVASLRKDDESGTRERAALLASLEAHGSVMARALATAEEEGATLDAIAGGDLPKLHRRFGERLNTGFGFEFVYITDADGNIIYSSEQGELGATKAFSWIRPAIQRALAEGQQAARGIVAGPGAAGLLVARPFGVKADLPRYHQPLLAVTVDVIDPEFLKTLSKPANLDDVQIVRVQDEAPEGRSLRVPNLYDGSQVELAWRGHEPGRSLLRELMPTAAAFSLLLSGIFLVLMVRAQRTAAALAASETQVRALALQDHLTGLANRGHFLAELEAALASRRPEETVALLFVDLDNFKEVNDWAGHGAGDVLLCAVADVLRAAVGDSGLAGRFGGDEFVVFARCTAPGDRDALAARIFAALEVPVSLGSEVVRVSASVGAAQAPEDANEAAELMRRADIALYRAKAEGQGTYRVFVPQFEHAAAETKRMASELEGALERGELTLQFQPQVELESERIVGFEALVRWDHPTRGRLPPAAFVPVAEESHLICALDLFVLRRAVVDARALGDRWIAVNMSPVTLRSFGIIPKILDVLEQARFDPARLEIEITESMVLHPSPEVQSNLKALRAAGIRLALDDFGTGYASVVHVRRFPFTKIKIDRAFITRLGEDADADAIVEYKVRLGRSLGLSMTAEGVETPEQLRFLRQVGMQQAQGYLFAPPLPLTAAVAMLVREKEQAGGRTTSPPAA